MKIIRQIGIIFTVCWLSLVIEKLLPFTFPASVIGMILLFLMPVYRSFKDRTYSGKGGFSSRKYGVLFCSCGRKYYELF